MRLTMSVLYFLIRMMRQDLPPHGSQGWREGGRGRGRGRYGDQYHWRPTTRASNNDHHYGHSRGGGSGHVTRPQSCVTCLLPTPSRPLGRGLSGHQQWRPAPMSNSGGSRWHPPSLLPRPLSHPPTSPHPHSSHHRALSVERPWLRVNHPLRVRRTRPVSISIMTYNVLAQSLIEKNMYLYQECGEVELQWETRRQLLLRELSEARADIVCLQEVEEEHYHSWFQSRLARLGYSGLYKKRTGSHSDGCAVFYNASCVKVAEWRGIEFQRRVSVLDRDNVGIVVRFEMSEESVGFCVATTHLLFNPRAGEVKLAQLACLLAELDKMATPSPGKPHLPCVLCGDMNSLPQSPLLGFIETGRLDYSQLSGGDVSGYHNKGSHLRPIPVPLLPPEIPIGQNCCHHSPTGTDITPSTGGASSLAGHGKTGVPTAVLSHPFTFSSAYPHPSRATPTPTITTYHSSAFETVDYIHYTSCLTPSTSPSPGARGAGFRLLSRRALVSSHTLLKLGPQPHHLLPSDHLWLLACLQLIPART